MYKSSSSEWKDITGKRDKVRTRNPNPYNQGCWQAATRSATLTCNEALKHKHPNL
jgi:hypothetical protein